MTNEHPTYEEAEAAVWWQLFKDDLPEDTIIEFLANTIRCMGREQLYASIEDLRLGQLFIAYFKDEYNDYLDDKRFKHGEPS